MNERFDLHMLDVDLLRGTLDPIKLIQITYRNVRSTTVSPINGLTEDGLKLSQWLCQASNFILEPVIKVFQEAVPSNEFGGFHIDITFFSEHSTQPIPHTDIKLEMTDINDTGKPLPPQVGDVIPFWILGRYELTIYGVHEFQTVNECIYRMGHCSVLAEAMEIESNGYYKTRCLFIPHELEELESKSGVCHTVSLSIDGQYLDVGGTYTLPPGTLTDIDETAFIEAGLQRLHHTPYLAAQNAHSMARYLLSRTLPSIFPSIHPSSS